MLFLQFRFSPSSVVSLSPVPRAAHSPLGVFEYPLCTYIIPADDLSSFHRQKAMKAMGAAIKAAYERYFAENQEQLVEQWHENYGREYLEQAALDVPVQRIFKINKATIGLTDRTVLHQLRASEMTKRAFGFVKQEKVALEAIALRANICKVCFLNCFRISIHIPQIII